MSHGGKSFPSVADLFPEALLPTFHRIWAPGGGALPIFKAHLFVARFLGWQLQEPDGASMTRIPPSMEIHRRRLVGGGGGWVGFYRFVSVGFRSWFFSGKCCCFLGFSGLGVCNVFFFACFRGLAWEKNSFCQLFGQFLGVFSCWGGKIDE